MDGSQRDFDIVLFFTTARGFTGISWDLTIISGDFNPCTLKGTPVRWLSGFPDSNGGFNGDLLTCLITKGYCFAANNKWQYSRENMWDIFCNRMGSWKGWVCKTKDICKLPWHFRDTC